jgi:lipopolysaccharide heptosyltransferase II
MASKKQKKPKRHSWHRRASQFLLYSVYRVLETVARCLPLPVVFLTGRLAGWLVAWVLPGYRRLAEENLRVAFGREKSPQEIRKMARQHLVTLGGNFLSTLKIPFMTNAQVAARLEWEGMESADEVLAGDTGLIYALLHMGNWEVLSHLERVSRGSKPATMYQPLGNPWMNAHVARLRAKSGTHLFDRHDGFFGPANWLKARGTIGILVDQHAGDGGVWAPLFDRLASTTNIVHLLSQRSKVPILPLGVHTVGVARWKVKVYPALRPQKSADRATAEMNQVLETVIRDSPADWFWVHNRWKTPKPNFLLQEYKRGVTLPDNYPMTDLQPFEILIRSTNWLGDACMAVPAVRAIRRGRPDARVTVLTPAKLADVWRLVAEVYEVIEIPKNGGLFAARKAIRRTGRRYDVALLLPNSLRSALEVWKNGIPRIVGFAGHSRTRLLHQIIPEAEVKGPPKHHSQHYLRMALRLGAKIDDKTLFAPLLPLGGRPVNQNRLGLCPGAEYGGAKRYPAERYAKAAAEISRRTGVEWAIFGAGGDMEVAREVQVGIGEGVAVDNLAGKTSLKGLIDELSQCRLLLTNDTGTMHLAALLGVPTVSIFGSTEPSWTGPLGGDHLVLRRHVECSPCFLRECPLDFRCMKEIEVEHVVEAVLAQLA